MTRVQFLMMDKDKQRDSPGEKPSREPAAANPGSEPTGFLGSHTRKEPRSWTPWIVATAVVIVVIIVLVIFTRSTSPRSESTSAERTAPYAANLPISQLVMSGATSFAGMQVTYIDGQIANTGGQTITGITVEVGFRNFEGQYSKRITMPLTLIRTRQPYVDIQPVSASPLKPGDHKSFRLIFDQVPQDWDQQLPEIKIVRTESN